MRNVKKITRRGCFRDKGRPPSIDIAKVRAMKAEGLGASEIAKALKIGRASVYRLMERLGA